MMRHLFVKVLFLHWVPLQLDDDDENVRSEAVSALAEIGSTHTAVAVPALIAALDSDSKRVRKGAVAATSSISHKVESVVPTVIAALDSDSEQVRAGSVLILDRTGLNAESVISALIAALNDDSEAVRRNAAISLSSLTLVIRATEAANADVVSALISALDDDDEGVRHNAAETLKRRAVAPSFIPDLAIALESSDPVVRRQVAKVLARIGEAAVPQLISSLQNQPSRYSAAYALGLIGPAANDAAESLKTLANSLDESPEIRWMAAVSLEEIGQGIPSFFMSNRDIINPQHATCSKLPRHERIEFYFFEFDTYTQQCVEVDRDYFFEAYDPSIAESVRSVFGGS